MRLAHVAVSVLALSLGACSSDLGTVEPDEDPGEGDEIGGGPDAGGGVEETGRVTEGLQALYRFEAGSGNEVEDVSGVGSPLDLVIAEPEAVSWTAEGSLDIQSPTIIQAAGGAAPKIQSACQESNAITLEAWVRPAAIDQNGPARIMTYSLDPQNRNFTLAQENGLADVRLRTTDTDLNGQPSLASNGPAFDGEVKHITYVRNGLEDAASVWVDGQRRGNDTVPGTFENWDDTYSFALANEITEDRPWRGEIFLAAVYCRNLRAAEIYRNYEAGY